ncbi:hypothetical protein [Comamonas sp. JC664]|uniref:hypothetical protein n=1 Tax=Comamonas sp. JC664 TaxID=2801917 RepID=UPI0017488070|nr:hypothetical protein [Comamonas sp. JC664]MBL0697875.1 hypothetical protein [Comamonas sp. JC664]GHG70095.1 hypothetical protein GCM10012319_14710 [Comamonas sp. KCTC 72670]
MPVERLAGSASLVDVLDRLLDRGLRWNASARERSLRHWPSASHCPIVVESVELRTHAPHSRGA